MRCLVTGAAGFIGSNFVDRLLSLGETVIGIDNFSTGQDRFLINAKSNTQFSIFNAHITELHSILKYFDNIDVVFHFAANADVRFGLNHPERDINNNTIGTFNVLEAMRLNNVKKIVFSSTGSIYGEPQLIPTPENVAFPVQTSLYGASKLAGEALIQAYSEGFNMQAWIFRFVSVLGERYTHGHVFDFYRSLKLDPNKLNVLGDGKQRKSYMYVGDCIDAILLALEKGRQKVNIFNLGVDGYVEVNDSIGWICKELGVNPQIQYSGGDRGWVGDNPFIFLDTKKIQSLGWAPKFDIQQGVLKTVQYLKNNEWVFDTK